MMKAALTCTYTVYCTYVHEHKDLIKYLHHVVMCNENPHLDTTCFLVPALQSLQSYTPIPFPQHSHQFPRWEHFNHDGISIYPRLLHPCACTRTITRSLILTNILWEDEKGKPCLIHNRSLELPPRAPPPLSQSSGNNFTDSV